jgi:DOPA 4,5-dioxygenase
MADLDAPYHAHIYYSDEQRSAAEALRDQFIDGTDENGDPEILFVGQMTDQGVGPHPLPQYEVHFRGGSLPAVISAIAAAGLRALVHPLTDDDMADHTTHAHWIGDPVELDLDVLDPPGVNQGVARFGKSDF